MNISRQKLIEELEWEIAHWQESVDEYHDKEEIGVVKGLKLALRRIGFQPPAESEIKRGKWIRYEDTHENSVKYICPFCGDYTAFREEIAESTVNGNYIYCRHCGAKNGEDQ